MKKEKWYKKHSLELTLSILGLLIILITILNYNLEKKGFKKVNEIVNNKKLDANFENLLKKLKDSTFVVGNKNIYQLQKDILDVKNEQTKLTISLEKKHHGFISEIATFWTIIGLLSGTIAVVFSFKEKVKQEVDKQVRQEVSEKLSKLTGIEIDFIKQNLNEYQKHLNLKEESKIIVINEKGTDLPDSFKQVINLFPNHEYINLKKLDDVLLDENLTKLCSAKLVVIEIQVQSKLWNISPKKTHLIFNSYPDELKEEIKTKNNEIEKNNKPFKKNLATFKTLAEKICKDTPLIYYGGGHFPRFTDDKIQKNITFANAPSQLYSNMLNMLKFKLETT